MSRLLLISVCLVRMLAGGMGLLTTGLAMAQADLQQVRPPVVVSPQALEIHQRGFVFDGHNDLPWEIRSKGSRSFASLDIAHSQPRLQTDIPRLKSGGVGAQFWSVFVPSKTALNGQALQTTLEQIDIVLAMMARYPDTFELARTYADIVRIRQSGKIASLIGVEGGHSIEDSLENLRRLYDLGARYMTLTHSQSLAWANSCSDQARCEGLSEFGKAVVLEMNRLGMLVDISHVSPDTMLSALQVSRAPVVFSHSSARAVADHVRNVPDDILQLLPVNGGVVMINFFSGFVVPESARNTSQMFELARKWDELYGEDQEAIGKAMARHRAEHPILPGTVHDVVDHIEHVIRVAGVDHVGLGSDYDGITVLPKQLEDVSCYPVITQALLDRGYSEADIHKVLSGNIMRIIQRAEQVAESLR
ncbi:MAG: dipeptidase [Pirellulaceae bacterium]|nr:dipeptidase [Pirellulaceae bacterium]